MKIRNGFVLRQIADSWMAVPVGNMAGEMNGLIALNDTAADIWKILQDDHTEKEVVGMLTLVYEADRKEIESSVKQFIAELRDKGMLEE